MSLPALDAATVDRYLWRLALTRPALTSEGLDALVAAHIVAVPFHNLFLLQNGGRDPGLPPVDEAVGLALAGRGGTCHQLTPPFVCLLRALGFEVEFAAADVANPGDHLVGVVALEGRRMLVDVANGQPYLRALPIDEREHSIEAFGWSIRFGPVSSPENGRTHALRRRMPDGSWKVVYRLDPSPRSYESFQEIIRYHHRRLGFGPFLSGLRAVRISRSRMLVLRDTGYERHTEIGVLRREVRDQAAVHRLLAGPFGYPDPPVADALATLRRTCPERWGAWGQRVEDLVERAAREAERAGWSPRALSGVRDAARATPPQAGDPRLLLAMTLTDRPAALRRFVRSLLDERRRFGWPSDRFALLALENSRERSARAEHRRLLARLRRAGFLVRLEEQGPPRRPLATARNALTVALRGWWDLMRPDLPHPSDGGGPVLLWMLDDDLELANLALCRGRPTRCRPFSTWHRAARLWREHPEISVALGGNTGAPPIPAHATLRTQLLDLREALRLAASVPPDATWPVQENPRDLADYYYDHSEAGDAHLRRGFVYEPRRARTAAEALTELISLLPSVLDGQQATRPLVYTGSYEPRPSTHRGGNALFFDLDALFAIPCPEIAIEGLALRRADTVWATRMAREPGFSIAAAPLPLAHGREEATAGTEVERADRGAIVQGILAQTWGTVLARLVSADHDPTPSQAEALLEARLGRIEAGFGACQPLVGEVRAAATALRGAPGWAGLAGLPEVLVALERFLAEVERRYPLDVSLPRAPVATTLARHAAQLRGPP